MYVHYNSSIPEILFWDTGEIHKIKIPLGLPHTEVVAHWATDTALPGQDTREVFMAEQTPTRHMVASWIDQASPHRPTLTTDPSACLGQVEPAVSAILECMAAQMFLMELDMEEATV